MSDEFKKVEKYLEQLKQNMQNLKPTLRLMGNSILNSSTESFENQKSPFGEKWKALSKSTLKKKKGSLKLIESSDLKDSIKLSVNKRSLKVGTNKTYAAIHQFGGKAGRGRKSIIPSRPFMPINKNKDMPQDLKDEIMEILKKGILPK